MSDSHHAILQDLFVNSSHMLFERSQCKKLSEDVASQEPRKSRENPPPQDRRPRQCRSFQAIQLTALAALQCARMFLQIVGASSCFQCRGGCESLAKECRYAITIDERAEPLGSIVLDSRAGSPVACTTRRQPAQNLQSTTPRVCAVHAFKVPNATNLERVMTAALCYTPWQKQAELATKFRFTVTSAAWQLCGLGFRV